MVMPSNFHLNIYAYIYRPGILSDLLKRPILWGTAVTGVMCTLSQSWMGTAVTGEMWKRRRKECNGWKMGNVEQCYPCVASGEKTNQCPPNGIPCSPSTCLLGILEKPLDTPMFLWFLHFLELNLLIGILKQSCSEYTEEINYTLHLFQIYFKVIQKNGLVNSLLTWCQFLSHLLCVTFTSWLNFKF